MYEPTEDVVEFIASYMNEAHGEALREIAAAAGMRADEVRIMGMTSTKLTLRVRSGGSSWADLKVSWPSQLSRREDIRRYLLQMQEDARFGQ